MLPEDKKYIQIYTIQTIEILSSSVIQTDMHIIEEE